MTNYIDLKLDKNDDFGYDISFNENGDFNLVEGFSTALQMSIYCERRALSSEVTTPQNRRGWWGNECNKNEGFEIGSKIWLLYQSRLNNNAVNLSKTYSYNAMEWLIDDNYFDQVIVSSNRSDLGINLGIDLLIDNNIVDSKSFELFENTRTGVL